MGKGKVRIEDEMFKSSRFGMNPYAKENQVKRLSREGFLLGSGEENVLRMKRVDRDEILEDFED